MPLFASGVIAGDFSLDLDRTCFCLPAFRIHRMFFSVLMYTFPSVTYGEAHHVPACMSCCQYSFPVSASRQVRFPV